MTAREFVQWQAFERVFGPLTLHERIDQAAALILWGLAGGKGQPSDYLPGWDRIPAERQSPEDMIAAVRSLQRRSRRRKR